MSLLFQFWQETDKAAYLLRQFFFHNLHDRLSTRPFLSLVEKKWLAFQVLFLSYLFMMSLFFGYSFFFYRLVLINYWFGGNMLQLLVAVKQCHENGVCHGKS